MPTLLEICDVTLEDLQSLYEREKSVKRVAKALGCSRPTATKWLRAAGVKTLGHRPPIPPTTSMVGEYGAVAKWLKDNPGRKLPASTTAAADMIGCSQHAIWNYLKRRRQRIIRYLHSFGDLRQLKVIIEDKEGRHINTQLSQEYTYKFHPRTYKLDLTIKVAGVDFYCQYKLKDFLTILRSATKM